MKKSLPATNPVTITLVQEMRNLYPMSTIEKIKYACVALSSALLKISLSWLDLFTVTKVSVQPLVDETCLNLDLPSLSNCSLNVSECSLAKILIPHFSEVSMIISFLPWFLGLIIVFSKRETFLRLFSHLTGNEKYSRLWLALFYARLILFPITVFLLLNSFNGKNFS